MHRHTYVHIEMGNIPSLMAEMLTVVQTLQISQEFVAPSIANSRIISMVALVTLPASPMGDMPDPEVPVHAVGYTAPELKVKHSVPFVTSGKQASSPYGE